PHPASRIAKPRQSPTASRTAGSVSSVRYGSRRSRMIWIQKRALSSHVLLSPRTAATSANGNLLEIANHTFAEPTCMPVLGPVHAPPSDVVKADREEARSLDPLPETAAEHVR